MTTDRSFLVVLIAALTGVALGRGAGAVIHPEGAAVVAVPVGALPPPDRAATRAGEISPPSGVSYGAPSGSSAGRDEGEPDEPRPDATGENPYEEPAPAHPAPFRLQVPLRDGMLRLPGGHFVMGS